MAEKDTVNTALQNELVRHPAGVSALAMTESLVQQGYSAPDAERAIQRALDVGKVNLGPKLKLRSTE
jgi:hypothetical protein